MYSRRSPIHEKLFKLLDHFNTESAKKEGERRVAFIKDYFEQIKQEI